MTEEIETKALGLWETYGIEEMESYLFNLGFTKTDISLMRERWSEGKSLYPYSE